MQDATEDAGALAPATLRAYAADWQHFRAWCEAAGCPPLPAAPAMVATYLAALAGQYSRAALDRRLAAIGRQHRLHGLAWSAGDPAIRAVLRGRSRRQGHRGAAALTSADMQRLAAACPGDLAGLRDRALLLLGFAAALRRAELVGIDREHLRFTEAGLRLRLPAAATDPEGKGAEHDLGRDRRREACPVRALEAWLEASGCQYGPVFRKVDRWGGIEHARLGGDAVRGILLRRARQAKLTLPGAGRLSPEGLRAGVLAGMQARRRAPIAPRDDRRGKTRPPGP